VGLKPYSLSRYHQAPTHQISLAHAVGVSVVLIIQGAYEIGGFRKPE